MDARNSLIDDFGAPPFLWSTQHARPGEKEVRPTLRSTCGSYLVNAPSIYRAASHFFAAQRLGHAVEVAEKHYLGRIRGISPDAKTLEAAMQIEVELEKMIGQIERPHARRKGVLHVVPQRK